MLLTETDDLARFVAERGTGKIRKARYDAAFAKFKKAVSGMKISSGHKSRCLTAGFGPSRSYLYDFKTYHPSLYLNDIERRMTQLINGRYAIVFHDKMLTSQVLDAYADVPTVHAFSKKGRVEFWSPEFLRLASQDSAEMTIFMKPVNGAGGKGAMRFKVRGGLVETDGRMIPAKEYIEDLAASRKDLVFLHCLEQSSFMNSLNPGSINTVRLLSMRDPETREIFVPRGVVRVGNKATGPVDNFSSGGYAYDLDTETGIIGRGQAKKDKTAAKIQGHIDDPDRRIEGLRLPDFDRVLKQAITLHECLPFANYIGWDLCLRDDGISVIEANNTTDVDVIQMHGPLLTDERVSRFYRHHHII